MPGDGCWSAAMHPYARIDAAHPVEKEHSAGNGVAPVRRQRSPAVGRQLQIQHQLGGRLMQRVAGQLLAEGHAVARVPRVDRERCRCRDRGHERSFTIVDVVPVLLTTNRTGTRSASSPT